MILLFVGAGGSAAVDPEQYPTTVEFFDRLPAEITETPFFTLVHEFLQTCNEEGQHIDIEKVLWTFEELRHYFVASRDTNKIAGWLMEENRLHRVNNSLPDLNHYVSKMPNFEVELSQLRDDINVLVHEFYTAEPNDAKLSSWKRFLTEIANLNRGIEVFTTNYDLVLEHTIRTTGIDIETGRKFDRLKTVLDMTIWDNPGQPLSSHGGRLTKLHGSVDWQRINDAIVTGGGYTKNRRKHPILYPGFKGEPNEEPFIKFHEHLRAVTGKVNAAIFVGFSFRDESINTILSGLPEQIPKYVISKDTSLPNLPFPGECQHFNTGFTEESITNCLDGLTRTLR